MSNSSYKLQCKLIFHKQAKKQGFYTEIQTVCEYMKNDN